MRARHRLYGMDVLAPDYLFYNKAYQVYDFDKMARLLASAVPILRKELDVPQTFRVMMKPIRAKSIAGLYDSDEEMAIIDPRRCVFPLLGTLAHEMVHAEQYHQGRLQAIYEKKKGWLHQWDGEYITNRGKTLNSYLKQPWEIEAYERQDILAIIVCEELGIDVGQ